jgi:hypothetical protein
MLTQAAGPICHFCSNKQENSTFNWKIEDNFSFDEFLQLSVKPWTIL